MSCFPYKTFRSPGSRRYHVCKLQSSKRISSSTHSPLDMILSDTLWRKVNGIQFTVTSASTRMSDVVMTFTCFRIVLDGGHWQRTSIKTCQSWRCCQKLVCCSPVTVYFSVCDVDSYALTTEGRRGQDDSYTFAGFPWLAITSAVTHLFSMEVILKFFT